MIDPAVICGILLLLLGGWGAFTTSHTLARSGWRRHPGVALLGVAYVASCLLPGVAMVSGAFHRRMLLPLGACYLAMIPTPCYFRRVNRPGWVRAARNVLFALVAAALLMYGVKS